MVTFAEIVEERRRSPIIDPVTDFLLFGDGEREITRDKVERLMDRLEEQIWDSVFMNGNAVVDIDIPISGILGRVEAHMKSCKHENVTPYYFTGCDGVGGLSCDDCGANVDPLKELRASIGR